MRSFSTVGRLLPLAFIALVAGCGGGSGTPASTVAKAAGAESCEDSGYGLVIRTTNKKETIYNCTVANGTTKCVTYRGGVAQDSTARVRLFWKTALKSQRPSCLD
jgi:hypothetical protein